MREVRHTFEHLMVILGVFVICLAIIFAIPGVRLWFIEEVPPAVVGVGGPRAVSSLMTGVDPKLLAEAVNDDDTRADMIALWRESIAEMEPEALAEVASELLSDPNTSGFIVNLITELDPDTATDFCNAFLCDPAVVDKLVAVIPLMDEGISDFLNTLIADEGASDLVQYIISSSDSQTMANFINALLGNEQTADRVLRLLTNLDDTALSDMVNSVLGGTDENGTRVSDLIIDVVDKLDNNALVDFAADFVASEGGVRFVTDMAKGLLEGENQQATWELLYEVTDNLGVANLFAAILMHNDGQLDDFLKSFFTNEAFRHMVNDALAEATPYGSVHDLFEDIQPALFGDLQDPSDGFLDYLWVEVDLLDLATYGISWDSEEFDEIVDYYIPDGSALEPLGDLVGVLVGALLEDFVDSMTAWVKVTGVRFQGEQPF